MTLESSGGAQAGLRVLDRMDVWALTAVNGGPYKPILNWLTQMLVGQSKMFGWLNDFSRALVCWVE